MPVVCRENVPTGTKTNEPNGTAILPIRATCFSPAPYRYGQDTSDVPGFNYAEVGNSQPPAYLVTVTEQQHVWPQSVNSDAGSVWGSPIVDRHYKGEDPDAFTRSALPATSGRPKNISRNRGLRCREQENMASAAGPGRNWSRERRKRLDRQNER